MLALLVSRIRKNIVYWRGLEKVQQFKYNNNYICFLWVCLCKILFVFAHTLGRVNIMRKIFVFLSIIFLVNGFAKCIYEVVFSVQWVWNMWFRLTCSWTIVTYWMLNKVFLMIELHVFWYNFGLIYHNWGFILYNWRRLVVLCHLIQNRFYSKWNHFHSYFT